MRKSSKAFKPVVRTKTSHARWFLTGVVTCAIWMAVGSIIARIQGDEVRSFVQTWTNYQGSSLIILATWLLLMIRSKNFTTDVSGLTSEGSFRLGILGNRLVRFLIVGSITVLGFVIGVRMGFYGRGAVLVFFWFTYFCVELATGLVTLHTLEILIVMRNLQHEDIKLSHYVPASTPKLRSIVKYFSTYILLMTIGLAVSLLGSLKGHWTGPQGFVNAFRWLWPLIYLPTCCFMLIYPHLVVHRLIQEEKERTLSRYQQELEDHLSGKQTNATIGQLERTNNLAQLVDRITASPDYVFDFGIALRTLLPLALNLLTLFFKTYATNMGTAQLIR
jgi:hypothetical protein